MPVTKKNFASFWQGSVQPEMGKLYSDTWMTVRHVIAGTNFRAEMETRRHDMEIQIRKLLDNDIEQMGIPKWPIWEKEPSRFDGG